MDRAQHLPPLAIRTIGRPPTDLAFCFATRLSSAVLLSGNRHTLAVHMCCTASLELAILNTLVMMCVRLPVYEQEATTHWRPHVYCVVLANDYNEAHDSSPPAELTATPSSEQPYCHTASCHVVDSVQERACVVNESYTRAILSQHSNCPRRRSNLCEPHCGVYRLPAVRILESARELLLVSQHKRLLVCTQTSQRSSAL